jgi:septal ring factor EnvC (AmiA/AmiB activator)
LTPLTTVRGFEKASPTAPFASLFMELVMSSKSIRRFIVVIVAVCLIGLFLIDSSAQKRRRKSRTRRPSTPRITNPAIYEPPANDNANDNSNSSGSESTTTSDNSNEDPQTKRIRELSSQVNSLTDKINSMEQSQRTLVDLERLSRAEQRSADLWKQLRDVEAQQADLQARVEEIDYQLRPENIDRSVAGFGSMRPEELREQRRKSLENEKARVQKQLDQLAANHSRLETAIAGADADIERLRKRLDAADQAALENSKTATQSEGAAPAPTPTPTPY